MAVNTSQGRVVIAAPIEIKADGKGVFGEHFDFIGIDCSLGERDGTGSAIERSDRIVSITRLKTRQNQVQARHRNERAAFRGQRQRCLVGKSAFRAKIQKTRHNRAKVCEAVGVWQAPCPERVTIDLGFAPITPALRLAPV